MAIVADAVATKVKVSLGTSLFIGVATAVTFSIGGAMLAGLAPGTGTGTTCYRQSGYPTLYQDANMTTVATGSCTTVLTTTEKPYIIQSILAESSIIDAKYAPDFSFDISSTEALVIRSSPSEGQNGTPGNILTIQSNVGVLNICFPKVGQVESKFYVGKSGTIYTDALLTKRATTEMCGVILNRAATPSNITAGSRLMNSGEIALTRDAVNYKSLGRFYTSGYGQLWGSSVMVGSRAPLRLTVWPDSPYPEHSYPYTTPADVLTLTTDIGTLNLCFPSRTYANENDGGYLFAGKDGTLYEDALLTKRATTEPCSTILARTAVPTSIKTGSRLMNSGYISLDRQAYHSSSGLGSFSDNGFNSNTYGTLLPGSQAPLRLTHSVGYSYPYPTYPYVAPADVLTLTTDVGVLNLCFPSRTYASDRDGGYLFAGKDGTLYEDALLTKRATTEVCSAILARASTPTTITDGSRLMNSGYISLDRQAYYGSSGLGSFSDNGFNVNSYGTILPGSKAPLRLTHSAGYSYPYPTYPYTSPADVLTLATDVGTLNLCLPSRIYTSDRDGGYLFAGVDGSLYEDALLTKRATSEACTTILARALMPSVITAGTRLTTGTYISLDRQAYYSSGGLGSFSDNGFNVNSYGTILPGSKAPLRLTHSVSFSYPTPTFPYLATEDVLSLTTDVGALSVCLPSLTYASDQDGGYLFVGKDGSTYNDALLQNVARKCSLNPIIKEITIE